MAEVISVSMSAGMHILAKRYKLSLSECAQEGILLLLHLDKNFPALDDPLEKEYYGKGKFVAFRRGIAQGLNF